MHCLLPLPIRQHSKPHLALGGVKNVSLNLTISNAGDDAYDTNIYFNFSREVFYINFWQKVRRSSSVCCLFTRVHVFISTEQMWIRHRESNDTECQILHECQPNAISTDFHYIFNKTVYFKRLIIRQAYSLNKCSVQKHRPARRQFNLKLRLSPADERMRSSRAPQQLPRLIGRLLGGRPVTRSSVSFKADTPCQQHMSFTHENKSECTCFMFPQALLMYRSKHIIHVRKKIPHTRLNTATFNRVNTGMWSADYDWPSWRYRSGLALPDPQKKMISAFCHC